MTAVGASAPPTPAGTEPRGSAQQSSGPRGAGALLLVLAAIVAAWPLFGVASLLVLPVGVLSAAVAAGLMPRRGTAAGNVITAVPLLWTFVVLAIAMPAALNPAVLPSVAADTARELAYAIRDGSPGERPGEALVAWLIICGVAWSAGGRLAAHHGSPMRASGFLLCSAPLVLATFGGGADGDRAWLGAVGLVAALLWATRGRLATALPAAAVIAIVALASALLIDVGEPWDGFSKRRSATDLTSLSTTQTYAPNPDPGTGATMFEVRAPQPGFWRMQTLERFDGVSWSVEPGMLPPLGQPASVSEPLSVTMRGLSDRRAAAPGRIASVSGAGPTTIGSGEAVAFAEAPAPGQSYAVTAEPVRASREQLAGIAVPPFARYEAYTRVGRLTEGLGGPAISLLDRLQPGQADTMLGRTLTLSQQLSEGAADQLEVVERVQRYLLDGGRFRYSLTPPRPGPLPLQEFLLETRVGYCQHFAGAAAMLLRMAGVPARVAVGFGTGQYADGRYRVRDVDAHAWVEVYFPRVGWVTFDPTPPSAQAIVAPGLDPLGGGDLASGGQRAPELTAPLVLTVIAVPLLLVVIALVMRWWQASPTLEAALLRLVPAARTAPSATFTQLAEALAVIGPHTAALAADAERQRFAPDGAPAASHGVRRRVWRALVADLGWSRAAWLLLTGRGPNTQLGGPKGRAATSVAPPR